MGACFAVSRAFAAGFEPLKLRHVRLSVLLVAGILLFGLMSARANGVLGYQLDISRCKVPTMETLYRIVDILADQGYNQFQLYTEHTFAYAKHPTVWCEASPMTPDEIRALDAYCAKKGIELVPNQNSFGHLEHWLRHPEYNDLADHPQAGARVKSWGNYVSPWASTLNPIDPRCVEFLGGLYDELFPCFKSTYANVGCDETIELEDADFATLALLGRALELRLSNPNLRNFRATFEPEYRRLWLRQNRLGGLKDSLVWLFGR